MTDKLLTVIVTYNSEDSIKDCLSCIQDQSFTQYEVLIIDNNSSDNTLSKVGSFLATDPDLRRKVNVIKNDVNAGFSKAVNLGLKHAVCNKDYAAVLLLNPDTHINKDLFSTGIKVLSNDKVGACSPLILYPDGRIWWFDTKILSKTEFLTELHHAASRHLLKGEKVPEPLTESEVEALTGCSMFIKTEAVRKTGFLCEEYFMYCEDLDYSLRLKSRGYKLKMFTECPIVHHVNDEDKSFKKRLRSIRKYRIYLTSTGRFILKYYPVYIFVLWLFKLPFALVFRYYKSHDQKSS